MAAEYGKDGAMKGPMKGPMKDLAEAIEETPEEVESTEEDTAGLDAEQAALVEQMGLSPEQGEALVKLITTML